VSRSNVFVSDTSALVADSLQAAYFRGMLADERAVVAQHLAEARARLAKRFEAGELHGISRLRQEIRVREAEERNLDRLIDALDRRFAARRSVIG
jgi:hypothetical protein